MDKIRDLISLHSKSEQSYSAEEAQKITEKMRVDTYNSMNGALPDYDCPKCKNRGSIAVMREDGNGYYMQDCTCMKIRRCILKMKKSGLQKSIQGCTFESFICTKRWQEIAKDKAKSYASTPDGWFLICGQTGSGKTHLCTAICRTLLFAEHEVIYMPWRDDISKLKALSLDNDERSGHIQNLKSAEILYIDDLFKNGKDTDGVARPSRSDIDIAFEILNYRCNNHLKTIVSTEKSPRELLEIDQAVGGRIIDFAKDNIIFIDIDTEKNYRLRNVIAL